MFRVARSVHHHIPRGGGNRTLFSRAITFQSTRPTARGYAGATAVMSVTLVIGGGAAFIVNAAPLSFPPPSVVDAFRLFNELEIELRREVLQASAVYHRTRSLSNNDGTADCVVLTRGTRTAWVGARQGKRCLCVQPVETSQRMHGLFRDAVVNMFWATPHNFHHGSVRKGYGDRLEIRRERPWFLRFALSTCDG